MEQKYYGEPDSASYDTPKLTFARLQNEHSSWAAKNFPDSKEPYIALLGVQEEVGELSHHVLKALQGIRGSKEHHIEQQKDAVGDILIFLADFCNKANFNMQEIIERVWGEVKQRDWSKNKFDGGVADKIEFVV